MASIRHGLREEIGNLILRWHTISKLKAAASELVSAVFRVKSETEAGFFLLGTELNLKYKD